MPENKFKRVHSSLVFEPGQSVAILLGTSDGNHISMALASDGQRVYVINSKDDTVSVVSTATNAVTHTLPMSLTLAPGGISHYGINQVEVSPDSQRIYVRGSVLTVHDTTLMPDDVIAWARML